MKFKYYLRGLGTGILFATIILFISYSYRMSDNQIKKKAEELGMIYPTTTEEGSDNEANSSNSDDTTLSTENKPSGDETETSSKEELTSEQPSTEEPTSEEPTTEELTSEEPSTEEPTTEKSTTEKPTTEDPTTNAVDENVKCVVKVTNRTSSWDVAKQLADVGIVKDADDFNDYLINNGYAYKIQNGTFTITKGMTYKEIAEYICSRRW